MCVCACACSHPLAMLHIQRSEDNTLESCLSPSAMYFPGIELRSSGPEVSTSATEHLTKLKKVIYTA